jgi:hypothetical protein
MVYGYTSSSSGAQERQRSEVAGSDSYRLLEIFVTTRWCEGLRGRHDLARTETGDQIENSESLCFTNRTAFLPAGHHTQCGRAATKESEYLPQRRKGRKEKKQYLSELGVLRVLAGGISESECLMYRKNCASRENSQVRRVRNIFLIKNSLLRALRASAVSSLLDPSSSLCTIRGECFVTGNPEQPYSSLSQFAFRPAGAETGRSSWKYSFALW